MKCQRSSQREGGSRLRRAGDKGSASPEGQVLRRAVFRNAVFRNAAAGWHKRSWYLSWCLLVLCCSSTALRGQTSSSVGDPCEEGDRCLIAIEDGPATNLNPLNPRSIIDFRVQELLHDSLFLIGDTGTPKASMIATDAGMQPELNCQDPLATLGRLKAVKSHTNQPLTVETLRDTYLAAAEASRAGIISTRYYDNLIGEVKRPGLAADQFKITWKRPVLDCKSVLMLKLVPREGFSSPNPAFWPTDQKMARNPIGFGPYKLVAGKGLSSQQAYIQLEAHTGYHKGAPLIPNIRLNNLVPAAEMVEQLGQDQAQLVVSLPKRLLVDVRKSGARAVPYPLRSWWYIAFNHRKPLMQDLRLRQALALITNRRDLARQLADRIQDANPIDRPKGLDMPNGSEGELSEPELELITGPFVPESPFYNASVRPFTSELASEANTEKRLEKADALLKAMGFEKNPRLKFWFYKGEKLTFEIVVKQELAGGEDVAHVFKQQLLDMGISATIKVMKQSEWDRFAKDADLAIGRLSFNHYDDIRPFFASNGSFNMFGYQNPEVDKLFAQYEQAEDFNKGAEAMRQAHERLARDGSMIYLWTVQQVAAFSRRVDGYLVQGFSFWVNPHLWKLKPRKQ